MNPSLYKESNSEQRRDAENCVKKFSGLLDVNDDDKLSLLDIGCGPGDVLVDIVLPRLKNKVDNVVGVDISKEMIKFANENYGNHFTKFFEINIESDFESMEKLEPESFDIVTSFHCLHWVKNQRKAFANIYKLMKPKARCLISFVLSTPFFEPFSKLCESEKYSKFIRNDSPKIIFPYNFEANPLKAFCEIFCETGFKIIRCEVEKVQRAPATDGKFEGI
jgi:juvenile hormone-III synthase